MILAPWAAAWRISAVSLARFSATAPRSEEHWIAATLTVGPTFLVTPDVSSPIPLARLGIRINANEPALNNKDLRGSANMRAPYIESAPGRQLFGAAEERPVPRIHSALHAPRGPQQAVEKLL